MTASADNHRSKMLWKLAPAILLVALGDLLFYQRGLTGSYIGFYAVALIGGLVAGHPGVRRDRRAWLAVAAALIFAGALAYDPGLLAWTLFWSALGIAALLPRTGPFDDGWRWFQRLAWHALRSPFAPLIDFRKLLRTRRRRPRQQRSRRPLLPVLALPVFGSLVFLFLFAAANPVLARLLYSVRGPDLGEIDIVRPLVWALLFTLTWSFLRPRLALQLLPTFDGRGDLPLPGVSVASVLVSLVAFNLVFALQNAMDVIYLWGEARLPGDMTMADYAHRGAYPLIATALLAALFVLVTLRPGSATSQVPAIRWLVMAWVAQNIFLVASSIERMIDYVGSYSLTELRIVVLGWMTLVAFGLAAICWRMLADKSAGWLINLNLAAATLLLTFASFVDLGTVAAQWNVRHAREAGGKAVHLDLCYLRSLRSSALLPLIELERRPALTPAFREQVQAVRQDLYLDLKRDQAGGDWTLRGARRLKQAHQELAGTQPVPIAPYSRGCNGSPRPSVDPAYPAEAAEDAPSLTTLPPEPADPTQPAVSRRAEPDRR